MPRWRVDILRKHAEHLGIVTAPNAQEALTKAVRELADAQHKQAAQLKKLLDAQKA